MRRLFARAVPRPTAFRCGDGCLRVGKRNDRIYPNGPGAVCMAYGGVQDGDGGVFVLNFPRDPRREIMSALQP